MDGSQLVSFLYDALFKVDSIWSIVVRALLWLGVSIVIIASVDKPSSDESMKSLKSNLGFFLFFIVLSSALIWMLFGFTKTS